MSNDEEPETPFESVPAADVITGIYRAILMREPDPAGLAESAHYLAVTGSVEGAVAGILCSAEFRDKLPRLLTHYQAKIAPEDTKMFLDSGATAGLSDSIRLDEIIRNHPAWRGQPVLAMMAHPAAMLSKPRVYELDEPGVIDHIASLGLNVELKGRSVGNQIVVDEEATALNHINLHFINASRNLVVLGPQCSLRGELNFQGDGNLCYCDGKGGDIQVYRVFFYSMGSAFAFGQGSTCVYSSFHIEGPNHHVVVGRDCMISGDVYAAATDNHAIVDGSSGRVLNMPGDLRIGPRAWIGFGTTLLKNAHVGEGSIVAARSTVTHEVAAHTIVAGAPARVIRTDVDWARNLPSETATLHDTVGPTLTSQITGITNPVG